MICKQGPETHAIADALLEKLDGMVAQESRNCVLADAITAAEARGRDAGIEEAAKVAEERTTAWRGATAAERADCHFGAREDEAGYIARSIRALAATPGGAGGDK